MTEALPTSDATGASPPTSPAPPKPTSSPASAGGPSPSTAPAGLEAGLFGPVPVRASPSRRRADEAASAMRATSGPSGMPSSGSVALQRSLASRLQAAMDVCGSPEYALTWKRWAMPWGPPICALRASARHTSGSGSSGWPTPCAADLIERQKALRPSRIKSGRTTGYLSEAAFVAGWPTPQTHDATGAKSPAKIAEQRAAGHGTRNLNEEAVAAMAAWPTPKARDFRSASGREDRHEPDLNVIAARAGFPTPTATDAAAGGSRNTPGSKAHAVVSLPDLVVPGASTGRGGRTGKPGGLNPELSRYLMGFPAGWGNYAPTATRSSQRPPPGSSGPSSMPRL